MTMINFYCPFGPPPLILSLACDTILIISQEALFCYPHRFRLLHSPQHSWGIRLFIHDKTVPIRDTYRREQAYKSAKHSEIKFQVNDVVTYPKFGEGTVEEIVQLSNSVRLHIRFADDEVKKIDQKWLLRSGHK